MTKAPNKANQQQSLRSLDSLAVARFAHGFAIVAQNNQQQVCRCLRRYAAIMKEISLFLVLWSVVQLSLAETLELNVKDKVTNINQVTQVWVGPGRRAENLTQEKIEAAVDGKTFTSYQYRILKVEHDVAMVSLLIERLGVGLNGCCKSSVSLYEIYPQIKLHGLMFGGFEIIRWVEPNIFEFKSGDECYLGFILELDQVLKYEKSECA